jgi:hypothetical protein
VNHKTLRRHQHTGIHYPDKTARPWESSILPSRSRRHSRGDCFPNPVKSAQCPRLQMAPHVAESL